MVDEQFNLNVLNNRYQGVASSTPVRLSATSFIITGNGKQLTTAESRVASLGFTYRFNKGKKIAPIKRTTGSANEEQEKIGE